MDKGKICGFIITGMIGFLSISPVTTFAAELDTESVTQAENQLHEATQTAVQEKMKKASEKWDALNENQKEEVYLLLSQELEVQSQLMDKLAELGILEKEDTEKMKAHLLDRYNKLKQSGEFPFSGQRGNQKRSK